MNKRGLTLIELLAVITIMGLILLVVLPSVSTLSDKAAEQQYQQTLTILKNAAREYVEEIDTGGLNNVGDTKEITLNDLASVKLITLPFINPKTKEVIPGGSVIKIIKADINEYNYELPL